MAKKLVQHRVVEMELAPEIEPNPEMPSPKTSTGSSITVNN